MAYELGKFFILAHIRTKIVESTLSEEQKDELMKGRNPY
jgi:hypothetical protein